MSLGCCFYRVNEMREERGLAIMRIFGKPKANPHHGSRSSQGDDVCHISPPLAPP